MVGAKRQGRRFDGGDAARYLIMQTSIANAVNTHRSDYTVTHLTRPPNAERTAHYTPGTRIPCAIGEEQLSQLVSTLSSGDHCKF